ncbi:MAG: RAMP superfamily CRISPR-associated protein [Candidatus Helarchaeota archaeon]
MIEHNVFHNRYIFKGKIKVISPLHIGTSDFPKIGDVDSAFIKYENGQCYIPGSTMKGYLRSVSEKILRNIPAYKNKIQHINDKSDEFVCNIEFILNNFNGPKSDMVKKIEQFLCPICKLYGAIGYASKIFIPDLPLIDFQNIALERRVHTKIDRDSDIVVKKGLFDIQYVPINSKFKFEAYIENATDQDLEILYYGLYFLLKNEAFLGGNKSRGYGKIGLELTDVIKFEINDIINNKSGKQVINDFLKIKSKKGGH